MFDDLSLNIKIPLVFKDLATMGGIPMNNCANKHEAGPEHVSQFGGITSRKQ